MLVNFYTNRSFITNSEMDCVPPMGSTVFLEIQLQVYVVKDVCWFVGECDGLNYVNIVLEVKDVS